MNKRLLSRYYLPVTIKDLEILRDNLKMDILDEPSDKEAQAKIEYLGKVEARIRAIKEERLL